MTSPTSPGRMKTRIRFDALEVIGEDMGGGDQYGWVAKFYRWAELRKSDGSEQAIAQRMQSVVPARIFVRCDPQTKTVTSAWRAVEVTTQRDDTGIESTVSELRAWALKTAEDIEGDGAFITMQAASGEADA